MKKLVYSFIALALSGIGFNANAQCTVEVTPAAPSIICGESIDLSALGLASAPALETTFDGAQIGPGWQTSATLLYNNPCGPSLDGTPSAWFGNVPLPRTLTTVGFDLQCGAEICFDLDFGADDAASPNDCEDPDLTTEGVYFQYSTDNGATWVDIFYFEPNSNKTGPYYDWANYCFTLPAVGWGPNVMFQWDQPVATSQVYDHWGIDNVIITPSDCGYYYDWDMVPGTPDNELQTVSPTTTTTYQVWYTNGIDDSCQTNVTVDVIPFDVTASATSVNLNCGDCTDLNLVLNNAPNMQNPNYTYSWTPTTDLSDPNIANPAACPTDNITYTGTITETTSGCQGSDDVSITVNGGGAVADFSIFPGNTGCAPFTVDFTNNSTGVSYEWDFDDGSPINTQVNPSHTFTNPGTYVVELIAFLPGAGCINYDTAYVTIEVGNNIFPVADFDYINVCGTTSVQVFVTGTLGLVYNWDMGDGTVYNGMSSSDTIVHDYGSTGTYSATLFVDNANCGTDDQITIDIEVINNPISFIYSDPTCFGFNDGSITVNTAFSTGNEICTITDSLGTQVNGAGTFSANQLSGGWYYFVVDLGGGCTGEDSVELWNPEQIIPSISITDVLCNGDATGIAEVDTVTGWQGNYADVGYYWNPNPAGVGGIGADSSYNMPAGTYTLTINDGNGCSSVIDFTISEPPVLYFSELGTEPAYCRTQPFQQGNGVAFAAAAGGTPDYDYEWFNIQDTTYTNVTTWAPLNPGQYQITVIDNNGCVLQEIITVDEVDPIADYTILSDSLNLNTMDGTAPVCVELTNQSQYFANPNNPNADTTFFWNLNYDANNPSQGWILSNDFFETFDTCYTDGGEYEICLVAINKNDCSDTLCQTITVYDPLAFTPINIFTPNGDGDNDIFTFEFRADAVSQFTCTIVDRWGLTVNVINDITEGWDGTDKNGSKVTDGVYFYVYEGVADNGTEFSGQGTVTVVGSK
jgi:gliding motility-associated-like protein